MEAGCLVCAGLACPCLMPCLSYCAYKKGYCKTCIASYKSSQASQVHKPKNTFENEASSSVEAQEVGQPYGSLELVPGGLGTEDMDLAPSPALIVKFGARHVKEVSRDDSIQGGQAQVTHSKSTDLLGRTVKTSVEEVALSKERHLVVSRAEQVRVIPLTQIVDIHLSASHENMYKQTIHGTLMTPRTICTCWDGFCNCCKCPKCPDCPKCPECPDLCCLRPDLGAQSSMTMPDFELFDMPEQVMVTVYFTRRTNIVRNPTARPLNYMEVPHSSQVQQLATEEVLEVAEIPVDVVEYEYTQTAEPQMTMGLAQKEQRKWQTLQELEKLVIAIQHYKNCAAEHDSHVITRQQFNQMFSQQRLHYSPVTKLLPKGDLVLVDPSTFSAQLTKAQSPLQVAEYQNPLMVENEYSLRERKSLASSPLGAHNRGASPSIAAPQTMVMSSAPTPPMIAMPVMMATPMMAVPVPAPAHPVVPAPAPAPAHPVVPVPAPAPAHPVDEDALVDGIEGLDVEEEGSDDSDDN